LVSDILRHKGSAVLTVDPALTIQALASLLADKRVGAAVVSADGIHVEGIVSERDIVRAVASHGPDVLTWAVSEICTRDVVVVAPDEKLDQIMRVMTERRFRHLPVVVDGQLRGLVSIGDVVKARVGELEMEQGALTSYITGTR
jgi:CBS domain-containing protein